MADHALLPSTDRALTRRVAVEQAERRAPSLVAAVVRDGRLVWTGGRGRVGEDPPTADTQYRIGSISKTFTAVLVLRLRDEGRLDLSDPLEAHLPGTPVGDRTIAQLLSHASGLTAEPPGPWWERTPGRPWQDLAGSLDQSTVRHRAGRRFHYSNLGYAVLGELVARLRGTSWTAAVRREILEPLGMTRTTPLPEAPYARGFAVHPWADVLLPEPAHDAVAMAPAGQLWSTVTDLGRWAAFCGGEGGEVLRADTISEMREPLVRDADVETVGYGLGLELRYHRGRRLVGHGGSMPGFLAALWVEGDDPTGWSSSPHHQRLEPDDHAGPARHHGRASAAPARGVGPARRGRPGAAGADRSVVLGAGAVHAAATVRSLARPDRDAGRHAGLAVPPGAGRHLDRPRRLLRRRDPADRPPSGRHDQPPRPQHVRAHQDPI
jgi:CubicO group peptidase (beta-lactamase class C family)